MRRERRIIIAAADILATQENVPHHLRPPARSSIDHLLFCSARRHYCDNRLESSAASFYPQPQSHKSYIPIPSLTKASIMPLSPVLSRRRRRSTMAMPTSLICITLMLLTNEVTAFLSPSSSQKSTLPFSALSSPGPSVSSSSLNVWWFGGTEQNELNDSEESCELVAVRIEKTSANSRRIAGDITVQAPLEDVWAILTDYNRLATHIPNLVESKIVSRKSPGQNGDGSFKCRLFQRGAQKIIGFEFGASVTMDMTESIVSGVNKHALIEMAESEASSSFVPQDRRIRFKCVDSQFFSEFDGEWKAKEQIGPDGQVETVCYYVVDVRPKGPVPVAALEWRIREDVPTNLRAVKAAALSVGAAGVEALNNGSNSVGMRSIRQTNGVSNPNSKTLTIRTKKGGKQEKQGSHKNTSPQLIPVMSDWDRDETMAKYL